MLWSTKYYVAIVTIESGESIVSLYTVTLFVHGSFADILKHWWLLRCIGISGRNKASWRITARKHTDFEIVQFI